MILNAEESKAKVEELRQEKINYEIKKIGIEIDKAIGKLKNEIIIYDNLMPETIVKLTEKKYKIDRIQTGPNEMGIRIKWG